MPANREAVKMADLFFSSIGQENPYPDAEIIELYHKAGNPAGLMTSIIQQLAERIAEEKPECAQKNS